MGKGTIISGGTDGQYQVQKNYNRTAYEAELARLANKITELEADIALLEVENYG